jgi:hypothetical protein
MVPQGATAAQARAALERYKDVMEAAEKIFEGRFDHIRDDPVPSSSPSVNRAARMTVCHTAYCLGRI